MIPAPAPLARAHPLIARLGGGTQTQSSYIRELPQSIRIFATTRSIA
jgi:hypothetical protein